jgi:YD repeat-containing protein
VKKVKVVTRLAGSEGIDAVGLVVPRGEEYGYDGFNRLLSMTPNDGSAATTFGYDGNGNQVSKTDASGLTQYVYDKDNRLVGVSLPGGASNAFEYDGNGLRVKKTDSLGTTRYLLDGLSVIAQYAPDGRRQAWYTQSLARIDEVLSVVNEAGKQWYQADALGSVYGLTSASGSLSALVYARQRYLNPGTGAWLAEDPWNLRDAAAPTPGDQLGGLGGNLLIHPLAQNRFGYALGNPALYADPLGRFVFNMSGATVGVMVGAVLGAYAGSVGCGSPQTGAFIGALMGALVGGGLGYLLNLRLILKILPTFVGMNTFELNLVTSLGRLFGIGWSSAGRQAFHINPAWGGHIAGAAAYVLTTVAAAIVLGAIMLVVMDIRLEAADEAYGR